MAVLAAGCTPLPPRPEPAALSDKAHYLEYSFGALPGWESAMLEPSLQAFLRGCALVKVFARACEQARAVPAGDERAAREFFEAAFVPYAVIAPDGADGGLVTGYYEPLLAGSRSASETHRHPIFGVPEDLIVVDFPELRDRRLRGRLQGRRLVPYYSRAEIDSSGGDFKAPVIAWTADPVELFFLQIQGSGQLRLESGEQIRLGYADQNGHPYRSLGRFLVERGELALEDASMQGIKAWAAANPHKLREALHHNASYVFFRELPATDGPIGALGVPLAAGYSLAVDRRYVPLGAPVYLASTYPLSEVPLERLMAAHDTGGAIRGAVRADFFWGSGAEAGAAAGRMRQQGRIWLLWPRGEALP
ncbi:MAG: murein transglycosylase A [Betaproteobacteria bacterium]